MGGVGGVPVGEKEKVEVEVELFEKEERGVSHPVHRRVSLPV